MMTWLGFLGLFDSFDDSLVEPILNNTIILLKLLWLLAESL